MMAILSVLLFGTAFAISIWSLVTSVRPQLHRYAALFGAAPVAHSTLPPRLSRVTVRPSVPARMPMRPMQRAAA